MLMMKKINLKKEKSFDNESKPFSKENLAGKNNDSIQTELLVADNTGAKRVECIKVLGGSKEDMPLWRYNCNK